MGRKCSVYGCRTNYKKKDSAEKVTVYSFPSEKETCLLWLACLPNKLSFENITGHMGVCALHWPQDAPLVRAYRSRHHIPSVPPSIFPNVPSSCVPTSAQTTPRSTKKATSSARSLEVDQMQEFLEKDKLDSNSFHECFINKLECHGFAARGNTEGTKTKYMFQTFARKGPVPANSIYFTVAVNQDPKNVTLEYEAFCGLQLISHPALKAINCWSQVDELLRFVLASTLNATDRKVEFLLNSVDVLNAPKNSRIYNHQDLLRAFSWFTQSRSLYLQLRTWLQLPSLSTLNRITATAKSQTDDMLFRSVFNKAAERCRSCIILIDEVYVKASISYRGGAIFGYAVDSPGKVANTLLCMMVKCFFGGQTFVAKILPCHALTADFQYNNVCQLIRSLEDNGANVVAIINDNNRVNQSFFSKFAKTNHDVPWIVQSPCDSGKPLFLLYDTVHLFKNLRNNWVSEKTKTLELPLQFDPTLPAVTAKWTHLEELYKEEQKTLVKLSQLTKASIYPTNIEKQKVSLALNVFSEKTSAALKTSSASNAQWQETSQLLDNVILLWKVFNNKTSTGHMRYRDPVRCPIDLSPQGELPLKVLQYWADCALKMSPKGQRIRSLTKDTANALHWTCKCLMDLSKFLLTTPTALQHQYVALGFFQQDDIEHHFAHFRMSAGSNYYITAEDVAHTHAMDRAKLMLEVDPDTNYNIASHSCKFCQKPLTDEELLALDELPDSTSEVIHDEKMSLFYIGGYIASKHPELKGAYEDFNLEPQHASNFTDTLNRGGLSCPSQELFRFLIYTYMFFKTTSKEQTCRKRLQNILRDFPAMFHLDINLNSTVLSRIINILMKRFCLQLKNDFATGSNKRKVAKLSSTSC